MGAESQVEEAGVGSPGRKRAGHWWQSEGVYLPLTIDVLGVTGEAIAEITLHADQSP